MARSGGFSTKCCGWWTLTTRAEIGPLYHGQFDRPRPVGRGTVAGSSRTRIKDYVIPAPVGNGGAVQLPRWVRDLSLPPRPARSAPRRSRRRGGAPVPRGGRLVDVQGRASVPSGYQCLLEGKLRSRGDDAQTLRDLLESLRHRMKPPPDDAGAGTDQHEGNHEDPVEVMHIAGSWRFRSVSTSVGTVTTSSTSASVTCVKLANFGGDVLVDRRRRPCLLRK